MYHAIAEYYDAENEHRPMLREDVPFLLRSLPRKKQRILELACGTGRAAIPLAQAGHHVVGVDYDPAMLRIARAQAASVGIDPSQLGFIEADLLRLRLQKKFDWIVLLFNTLLAFPAVDEIDAVLQGVVRHLKPRGRFWLDIFQPNLHLLAQPASDGLDPLVFYVPGLDRTVQRTTSVRRDAAAQTQRVTFHYTWFDRRGMRRRQRVAFDLTSIFPRELRLFLERNGLEIEKTFGNYDGSALTADSPRIIAACRHLRG